MSIDTEALSNEDVDVSVSDDGFVAYATIQRPEKRNAINENVFDGLLGLPKAVGQSDVRVVVIRGAEGTFSSGGDLAKMSHPTIAERRRRARPLMDLYDELTGMGALSLAAVEGYCLAGGLGVASACDFVISEEGATFGTPEVDVGLFPMLAMAPMMRAVSEKKGLKLMFTGELIDANAAAEMGLVTEVVRGNFEQRLSELLDDLVNNSPTTLAMGKEAYYAQREMTFTNARRYLREMITLVQMSDDAEEGIAAFQADREPDWRVR